MMLLSIDKIIRVDDDTTFPSSIQAIIKERLPILTQQLNKTKKLSENEMRSALQQLFTYSNNVIAVLTEQIKDILEDCFFEGYHNTRTLTRNELYNTGLRLLTPESYVQYMKNIFSSFGIAASEQAAAFNIITEYLDNEHGNRTNQICFFTPYSLCQEHSKFAKNIGGEICEFGLKNNLPHVYKLLTLHGFPVTVKFGFKFQSIVAWQKNCITIEIIRHFIAKLVFNYNYRIIISTALVEPIKPDDIIEILDFVDEH